MIWRSRDLRLLYINDDQGAGTFAESATRCVRIESIPNLRAAAEVLLRERFSNRQPFIDAVLSDANMELDFSHNDSILWTLNQEDEPAHAFGPLLALPFLSAPPWCQFVPFSAYWTNPNVYRNGYTLVAIALILTAIDGEVRSTKDAQRQIEVWRGEVGEQSLRELLPKAIADIRLAIFKLCGAGAIQLNGVDETIHQLELWKIQANKTGLDKQSLPLNLNKEPICLEVLHPGQHAHLIHISSLFADVLDFAPPASLDQIQVIIDTLNEWSRLEHVNPMHSRSAYRIACSMLYKFMPGHGDNEDDDKRRYWTPMLKEKISAQYQIPLNTDASDLAIRLTILFACVRAWYLVKFQQTFDAARIREYVYHFVGADRPPENGDSPPTPSVPFRRLLGADGGKAIGTRRYQRPFREIASCYENGKVNVLKAYMLDDEDELGALDWREKLLCQYFVESGDVYCDDEPQSERTIWTPEQYPRWMRIE